MYARRLIYSVVFLMCILKLCSPAKLPSAENSYNKGVDAYSKERWSKCIEHFEEALHLFKLYKTIIINCRLKCMSQETKSRVVDIEEIKIYEKFINMRLCITKCQTNGFDETRISNVVSEDVLQKMQNKKPYEYLHICYYQMGAYPKAASAAYTYLMAYPNDDKMKNNVQYYTDMPEVDANEVVDLESEDFKIFYNLGLKEYNFKKWGETIANMEEAITDYLSWENMCRAECQHQSELEWSPEFTITISTYMLNLLLCKQKCQDNLKSFSPSFKSGLVFLADVLNYLQISYYHMGRIEDASRAVQSFLLLAPNDEIMLANKDIYDSLTDHKNFVERADIAYYLKRDTNEKIVLDLFSENLESTNDILTQKE